MQVTFLRKAHRFIKNADKPLKLKIKMEILKIKDNPFNNPKLTGTLKGLYSHHFSFVGMQYRIIYKVIDNIIIIVIGSRENIYRDLN